MLFDSYLLPGVKFIMCHKKVRDVFLIAKQLTCSSPVLKQEGQVSSIYQLPESAAIYTILIFIFEPVPTEKQEKGHSLTLHRITMEVNFTRHFFTFCRKSFLGQERFINIRTFNKAGNAASSNDGVAEGRLSACQISPCCKYKYSYFHIVQENQSRYLKSGPKFVQNQYGAHWAFMHLNSNTIPAVCSTTAVNHKLHSILKATWQLTDLAMVIHAMATSRLYYCNLFYVGLLLSLILKFQVVQNAVVHVLTGILLRAHIQPVLYKMH